MKQAIGAIPPIASWREKSAVLKMPIGERFRSLLTSAKQRYMAPGSSEEQRLRILGRLPLGGKQALLVVSWGEQQFLIGSGGSETAPSITEIGVREPLKRPAGRKPKRSPRRPNGAELPDGASR